MRALLDVSLFGHVARNRHQESARTGIFRVVEQSAVALTAQPGVDVSLCATEDHDWALTFAEAHPVLRTRSFASEGRTPTADVLRRRVMEMEARGAGPRATLPLRVARRAVRELHRVRYPAPIDPVSRLSPPTLARADVYHSPVFALPEQACSRDGPRRFLTVYDVIPLLHPELFSWGGEQWLRAIVDSVRPDDCVLTISQRTKDDLLTLRPAMDPDRVFVTHLAADPARFYPCDDPARLAAVRGRYGIPEGPYVLSVGTLEPRKNLPHLLRTFADLVRAERADDLRLVLTGAKGWDFETIFSEVEQLAALRDRVVFTGYVDDGDLAPLYSGAAVFVYPSLYEGFGLPPLEAMQCGTPVITSNTSSLPEVVGDAGLMVDPRDGDALAQAMLDVYRAPGRRADLAARALVRAAQFSWDRYARETVAAYRAAT